MGFCNLELTDSSQAATKKSLEAELLYAEAVIKINQALKIKPDNYDALNFLGTIYSEQARMALEGDSDGLYEKAYAIFTHLSKIYPENYVHIFSWATALCNQAIDKSSENQELLYDQACKKFSRVVEIEPDYFDALHGWSDILFRLAKLKNGLERFELLEAAKELLVGHLVDGYEIAYNLACIEVMLSNFEECKKYLENCANYGKLPNKSYLESDSDLDPVRGLEWFKDILEKAPE